MDFGVGARQVGARTVISVAGELDVFTAPQLRDQLMDVIERGDRDLLVDLTRCEFIDSSGLSALVTGLKRVRAMGGDLGLVCPAGNVRRLIEVAALDQVFELHDDVESPGG